MNQEDHIQAMAAEAVGNWRKFESFGWHDQPDDADQWCIVYTSTRDSGLLDESNAAFIDKAMAKYVGEGDCTDEHHGHWGCGYIDGYAIRVYRPEPTTSEGRLAVKERTGGYEREATDAFRCWAELKLALADYPCLDESDYSQREYDATIDNIRSEGQRYVADGAPEDWPTKVFSWFWDNKQEAVESQDDQGGCPREDEIKEALSALGWLQQDDETDCA